MFATARSTISPLASPTLRNFAHSTPPARVGLGFNFPIPVASGSGVQTSYVSRPPLRRMRSSYMYNSPFSSLADGALMPPFNLTPSSLAVDDSHFIGSPLAKSSGLSEGQMQTSAGSIASKAVELSTASRIARWERAYAPTPRKSNVGRIGLGISGLTFRFITSTNNVSRMNSFSPNTSNRMARKNQVKSVAFGADGDEDCFADTEADSTTSLKRLRRRSSYSRSVSFHPKKLVKLMEERSIPLMAFMESDVSSLESHFSTPSLTMPPTPSLRSSSVLPSFAL